MGLARLSNPIVLPARPNSIWMWLSNRTQCSLSSAQQLDSMLLGLARQPDLIAFGGNCIWLSSHTQGYQVWLIARLKALESSALYFSYLFYILKKIIIDPLRNIRAYYMLV